MFSINADELPRFMACNGSRQMFRSVPPSPDGDNTTRDEGTAAHYMAVAAFNNEFTIDELIDRKAPNGVYMDDTMAEYVQSYIDELPAGGAMEQMTSFSGSVATGNDYMVNARADFIAFDELNGVLHVRDFKYGWRLVEPKMHWTLIAHAIGWCMTSQIVPRKIIFSIHQPRPHHRDGKLREWEIGPAELMQLQWQLVAALGNPSDILQTGPHCDTCPALATCPAARSASYNAIDMADTVFNETVENNELTFHIDQLRRAVSTLGARLEASEELAVHRLRGGAIMDNYSVEPTWSNRRWKDGIDVNALNMLTGKDCAAKAKPITPAQAEKLGVDKATVNAFSEKIPTGHKLVRVSATAKAQKIFGDQPKQME